MLNKILTFILGVGFGVVVIYYHKWFAGIVGRSSWAEKVFGGGGTYTMWKLIGLLIIILTILYIFGDLDRILNALI